MTTPVAKTNLRNRKARLTNGKENNLNREVKDLRRKLEDERAKGEDLELDNKNKDVLISKLTEDIDVSKARLRSLNDTLANTVTCEEYDQLKAQYDDLKNKYDSCLNDLKFRTNCVKDLEEELKAAYASNNELNNKLDSLMKDMEKVAKEYIDYNQLKAKYEDLVEKSKVFSEENEDLKRSVEAYREANRKEILTEANVCSTGNKSVSSDGDGGEPMSLFTEMMLREREDDLDKIQKNYESLKKEVEELKEKIRDMDRLKQENQNLAAQKSLLMDQVRDLYHDRDGFLSKREAEKQRCNEMIKELQDKLAEKDTELSKVKYDHKKDKKEVEKLQHQVEDLEKEMKKLNIAFTSERRTKERILRENMHLEKRLDEELMKLSKATQSIKVVDKNGSTASYNNHLPSSSSPSSHLRESSQLYDKLWESNSLNAVLKRQSPSSGRTSRPDLQNHGENNEPLVERRSVGSSPIPPRPPPRHNIITSHQVDNRMTINVITSPVTTAQPNLQINHDSGGDKGNCSQLKQSNFVRGAFRSNSINIGSFKRCNRDDHLNYAQLTTLRNSHHVHLHHHHHHPVPIHLHPHRPSIHAEDDEDEEEENDYDEDDDQEVEHHPANHLAGDNRNGSNHNEEGNETSQRGNNSLNSTWYEYGCV